MKPATERRKWNVGELVLAKVKGYAKWPAKVSKPEDSGEAPTLKTNKIFVTFFGTNRFCFCSYSNVIPFTRRRRIQLLGMLQQKKPVAANLCRAIQEICAAVDELQQTNLAAGVGAAQNEIGPADDERKDANHFAMREVVLETDPVYLHTARAARLLEHSFVVLENIEVAAREKIEDMQNNIDTQKKQSTVEKVADEVRIAKLLAENNNCQRAFSSAQCASSELRTRNQQLEQEVTSLKKQKAAYTIAKHYSRLKKNVRHLEEQENRKDLKRSSTI